MEFIDQGLQQRVWQRVQGGAPTENPEGLLLDERTDEVQFRQMGHRELAAQSAERAAVLQGLCRLSDIPCPQLLPKAPQQAENIAIRRLLGRLLRRHREYCRLSEHPEYGILYEALARMTQASAVLLTKQAGHAPLRNQRK